MPRGLARISRKWWLIGLLVLVVIGATVLAVSTQGHPRSTGANVAQPGSPTPEPAPSGSAAPSASPSASASASHSAAPSARANGPVDPHRPNCAPHPSGCGFPDGSNTGVPAGTKLTVVNGDMKISQAGAVIDGKDIRGCVDIEAPKVTIRRSKIACANFYVVASFSERYSGGGAVLQDVEIDCLKSAGTGIGYYGLTATRVNIHGCENGFDIDNTMTVQDSYIHDLNETATAHTDGIQLAGGAHITITHNTIFNPGGTSAVISHPSANSDVLVSSNLLAGGAYTLYCPRDSSTNFRVINNRFSTMFSPKSGAYGPWTDCEKAAVVTGNVWDANLQALPNG